jgi:streptogramin lyase
MKSGSNWPSVLTVALVAATGPARAEIKTFGTSPPAFALMAASESSPAFQQLLTSINPWGLALDPETGRIYFSDPTAGLIGSINPAAPVPTITQVIQRPGAVFHGIALDGPGQRLFFLDSSNNSVNALDLTSGKETNLAKDDGITRPNDIAYDPVRRRIIFTDSGADGVGVLDLGGLPGSFEGILLPETVGAWGVAVHPSSGNVYFSSFDRGAIYRLDLEEPVAVATGLDGPRGLQFDRHGRLFCLESGPGKVIQIPLSGQTVSAPVFPGVIHGRAFLLYEGDDRDGDHLLDAWERRFAATVHVLNAASDPDQDGTSAFDEQLFHGTPLGGADPPPVRSFTRSGPAGIRVVFEGPREGYRFGPQLSSDLVSWHPATGSLTPTPLADPLFATWTLEVPDLTALGLSTRRVFVRFAGSLTPP